MGAIAERLVRRVAATAEAGAVTFVRNLVPLNINDCKIASNLQ